MDVTKEIQYRQECKAISCALQSPVAAFSLMESLKPEDFSDSRTSHIVEIIHRLILDGHQVSVSSVQRKLKAQKHLVCLEEDVVPSKADPNEIDEFIAFVIEQSRLRQLEEACINTKIQIGSGSSEDLVGELMQKLVSISMGNSQESFTSMERLFDNTYSEIANRGEGKITGYTTSVLALDELIGGFQRKKLYVVAGRPGMAKSTFAMHCGCRLAYFHDVPVAFFSVEMPENELMRRVMANITGVEYWRIEKKYWNQDHLDLIKQHRDRMIKMPFHVNDSGSVSLSQMVAKVKGLKIRSPNLGVVFIDYLQLMKIPIARGSNRDIAIGETTRALKELAKDLDISVVLLSQVKRAVEDRDDKRPTLADLRESGNIEQDADVVIFPYRDFYYTEDPLAEKDCEFVVAKNRAGRVGTAYAHVDLDYQKFFDTQGEI